MEKAKAMARLDAIEAEAKELRKIIETGASQYRDTRLYVGIKDGNPYILVGNDGAKYFRFHQFVRPYLGEKGWDLSKPSGQECLDAAIEDGIDIHEFTDTREAFKFFLDHYKG